MVIACQILLEENGYEVVKEYYVNDAGKQIEILVTSVIQRYHELIDSNLNFSYEDLYKGDYIWDIAAELHRNFSSDFQILNIIDFKDPKIDLYMHYKNKDALSIEKFLKIREISINAIF